MSTPRSSPWLLRVGLLLASLPGSARAQTDFEWTNAESGLSVYSNDDQLTVVSPWVDVRQRVAEPVVLGVSFKSDTISAASVDIVTAATDGFEETRYELGANGNLELPGYLILNGGYIFSTESDTETHTVSLGASKELFGRNLTLAASYALGLDRIGRADEPESVWRDRQMHRIDLSATQVLGRSTIGSFIYSGQQMSGFLAGTYRQVPVFPRDAALQVRGNAQWVPERHPDERVRHAGTLRVRHALGRDVFVHGEYRGYLDTWAMRSNTAETGAAVDIGSGLIMEAYERFYWQSSVSFFRSVYTVNRAFITRDRRLSKSMVNTVGLALRYESVLLDGLLKGEYLWQRYDDFRTMTFGGDYVAMPDTNAFIVQLALSVAL